MLYRRATTDPRDEPDVQAFRAATHVIAARLPAPHREAHARLVRQALAGYWQEGD